MRILKRNLIKKLEFDVYTITGWLPYRTRVKDDWIVPAKRQTSYFSFKGPVSLRSEMEGLIKVGPRSYPNRCHKEDHDSMAPFHHWFSISSPKRESIVFSVSH